MILCNCHKDNPTRKVLSMKKDYLLGATNNNEIVTCSIDVRSNNNEEKYLSVCFNVYSPICENQFVDYVENRLEDMDKSDLYDLCADYDCKPSELAEYIVDFDDAANFIDMSWCADVWDVSVDDYTWYFENTCYGQHDTRNEIETVVNQEAYDLVHELWDNYHLNVIGDDVIVKLDQFDTMLCDVDASEWISDYIQEYLA